MFIHASGSSFLILGFVFSLIIHIFTVLMHREEIYVQKKKHIRISDLYSDGNEDMVETFQITLLTRMYRLQWPSGGT